MSKIQFSRRTLDGLKCYPAKNTNKFRVWQRDGKFYLEIKIDKGYRYPSYAVDGFDTLQDAEDWLNLMQWESATVHHIEPKDDMMDEELEWAMEIFGLAKEDTHNTWSNVFEDSKGVQYTVKVNRSPSGLLHIDAFKSDKKLAQSSVGPDTYDVDKLFRIIDSFMRKHGLESIESCELMDSMYRKEITAAISTKDLTKGMVRCKSSNVWGYNINIRDKKSPTGDMLMQFKGKNGGPGDVYIYYDVPVRLYRRMHSAPSKGHFFWVNIRNTFSYAKLTGNKRGVLPNAIN